MPGLVVPWTVLTRGFLLARSFVVLAMLSCQTSWRLVGDGEKPTPCDPKCGQRDGAAGALLEDDRHSMVLEAGMLEDDRLSMLLETGASTVDASSSRLRGFGAGEAQQPDQRGRRAAQWCSVSASWSTGAC